MKHLKSYKLFESKDIRDLKEDIKNILFDISDDEDWDAFIFEYQNKIIISIETSFGDDFIYLPPDSKDSIERLIDYMKIENYKNYNIKVESNIIVIGGDDIIESDEINIDDIEDIEFTPGKQLLVSFWK